MIDRVMTDPPMGKMCYDRRYEIARLCSGSYWPDGPNRNGSNQHQRRGFHPGHARPGRFAPGASQSDAANFWNECQLRRRACAALENAARGPWAKDDAEPAF